MLSMNNDVNKSNDILGILNVKHISFKNGTATTSSLFTTVCLISHIYNLKMHSQMCLCGSRVSCTFTTHKRCTVKSYS
jgi:hypothetical protein